MECKKYEIIEDGGRKRIRSLRDFTVQDRHVCVGDLGGYVYDERTLGQRGNFNLSAGSRIIYGKHRIASPDEMNKPELPPTKKTW